MWGANSTAHRLDEKGCSNEGSNAVTLVADSGGFLTFPVDAGGFYTFELVEVFVAVSKPSSCGSFLLGVAAMPEPSPASIFCKQLILY
ncbi:hypothetical protein CMV_009051 [Castanea mollissima]|uniref:Uncharacterized protein n=1 Tax=Castanea mollissima TaxID=60419 RepID=A0A8J4VZ13_9ROSI|nr:hypothetical protein CMV_009051 [Castanea mollissima]